MSNNSWGDLVFKLVGVPFVLLLLAMVIHQAIFIDDDGLPNNAPDVEYPL